MKKIKRMPLLLKTIENVFFVSSHPRSYYTALKFNIIYRCKPLPLSVCLSLISFNHSTLIIIIITTIPSHHQYRRLSLSFSYTCRDGCSFLFVLFVCFFFNLSPLCIEKYFLRCLSNIECVFSYCYPGVLSGCFYFSLLWLLFIRILLLCDLKIYTFSRSICVFALRFGHPGLFHHHLFVFFVSVYLPFTIIIITSHHYHHHHHY